MQCVKAWGLREEPLAIPTLKGWPQEKEPRRRMRTHSKRSRRKDETITTLIT